MIYYLLVTVLLLNFIILDDHLFLISFSNHSIDRSQSSANRIDCAEFNANVSLISKVAEGAVKEVWLGKWSTFGYIAVSFLKNSLYSDDFIHNIHMLSNFTDRFHSPHTAQFLGECDQKVLFTKFYRLGSLSNLYFLLRDPSFLFTHPLQSKDCFQFCIRYAQVIDYLHNSPLGVRVMCDSNDLHKLASQFLIDDDLTLVANDLDALPDATHQQIKCGTRLIGDLIAPEQLNSSSYDQQIDIYKLPYLCDYVLSLCARDQLLDLLVNQLHVKCLDPSPSSRPSSSEVYREYLRINYTLFN